MKSSAYGHPQGWPYCLATLSATNLLPEPIRGNAMSYFEADGDGWLSDRPDQKVAGTLQYTQQSGLRLELNGAFGGGVREIAERRIEHDFIYGSANGVSATLADAHFGLVNS